MDQHNNNAGIAMAQRLWNAGRRTTQDMAAGALQELDSGRLVIVAPTGGRLVSSAGWRMYRDDAWRDVDPDTGMLRPAAAAAQSAATGASAGATGGQARR